MSYSGFLSDPEYTRRSQNENVTGNWTFEHNITCKEVIRGTAIATYYGDLAEYYFHSPMEQIPLGTIVKFGGEKEITKTKPNDRHFFGIVSSKPGIELNKKYDDNSIPVALCGKDYIKEQNHIYNKKRPFYKRYIMFLFHNKSARQA